MERREHVARERAPRRELDALGRAAKLVLRQRGLAGGLRPSRDREPRLVLVRGEDDRAREPAAARMSIVRSRNARSSRKPSSSAIRSGANAPTSSRPYGSRTRKTSPGESPKYPGGPSSIPR
jgi:hypothetical protein